jgi:hypothetical protein
LHAPFREKVSSTWVGSDRTERTKRNVIASVDPANRERKLVTFDSPLVLVNTHPRYDAGATTSTREA